MTETSAIQIIVNGEKHAAASTTTIAALLESMNLDPGAIVVQRNEEILKRDTYATIRLDDGDVLEIVRFVGGG